ncbi:MAG: hypothetical protein IKG14_01505 [Clostridia bacterium]|nr:hypothetical protein [Clostridia bacterium]
MNKYKLTESQLGIFLYNKFFKAPAQINPCGSVVIDEILDFIKLKRAINIYVEKNEATRIHICNTLLGPRQYIEDFKPINIRVIDIEDESAVRKIENRYSNFKFNLTKDRLFKVELVRFKDGKGGIVCCFNHIISDGFSMELALRDIINIYRNGEDDYNPGSYIKHLELEQKYFSSNRYKKDKAFWEEETEKLKNPKAGIIPYDKNGEKNKSATITYKLDKKNVKKIQKYCKENKISEYSFFTSVFNLYVGKVSQSDEFTIQMVTSNRKNHEEKNTFGPFFDGAYFFAKIKDIEIGQYIKETSNHLFRASLHYKYPVSKVTKLLKKKGIKSFIAAKIYFSYQVMRNTDLYYKKKCKINWAPMKGTYIYDILINLHDIGNTGNIYMVINYMANRYKKETIDKLSMGIAKIIDQILKDDKKNIGSIEI